jgi:hypothetical protein
VTVMSHHHVTGPCLVNNNQCGKYIINCGRSQNGQLLNRNWTVPNWTVPNWTVPNWTVPNWAVPHSISSQPVISTE